MTVQTTKTVTIRANAKRAEQLSRVIEDLVQQEDFSDCTLVCSYDVTLKQASFAFTAPEATLEMLLPEVEILLSPQQCRLMKRLPKKAILKASACSALALSALLLLASDKK